MAERKYSSEASEEIEGQFASPQEERREKRERQHRQPQAGNRCRLI